MRRATKILVPLLAAVVILPLIIGGFDAAANCEQSAKLMSEMQVDEILVTNDSGKIVSFDSHIADNRKKRANGYQHICEEVINKSTILFVYTRPTQGRFHMNNVEAPLDIGFFDDKGKLVRTMVMNTYADGNNKLYGPGSPFQFALEARVGFFDDHDISEKNSRLLLNSVNR
jgi:uncharacterized membrane protein (UPF0127 family)